MEAERVWPMLTLVSTLLVGTVTIKYGSIVIYWTESPDYAMVISWMCILNFRSGADLDIARLDAILKS
jgi:hypothetical protein